MNWFYDFIAQLIQWLSTETTTTFGMLLLLMAFSFIIGTYGSALIRIKK